MTKHPHYYAIRAFADGWKVERYDRYLKMWLHTAEPIFNSNLEYRVIPDEEGWLPWYGEDRMPDDVDPDCLVVVNSWDKSKGNPASIIDWPRVNKYRIVQEEADPYAELKKAAADPTKQIRVRNGSDWKDSGYDWGWGFDPGLYEIRDKPKTKKVKLLAWFDTYAKSLKWYEYGAGSPNSWLRRVPSEDKEVEIEE